MGNPDLIIVFNNGEVSFFIVGQTYNTREEAIQLGLEEWRRYIKTVYKEADKPEELYFEIKSINIYELWVD